MQHFFGQGARSRIWLLISVATLLSLVVIRIQPLLSPPGDARALLYWSQSILDADNLGMGAALRGPDSLRTAHHTVAFELLAPAYVEPLRLSNVASALLLATAIAPFSGHPAAAEFFATAVVVCAALLLFLSSRARRASLLTSLAVPLMLIVHPGTWMYLAGPSWHSITLLLLAALSVLISRHGWHTAVWSSTTRALSWLALLVLLYSMYLIPLLLIGLWMVIDVKESWNNSSSTRKSTSFWLSLLALYSPAIFWVVTHPTSTMHWLDIWTTLSLPASFSALARTVVSTAGLICVAAVAIRKASKPDLVMAGFGIALLLVIAFLNDPRLVRIDLFLWVPVAWFLALTKGRRAKLLVTVSLTAVTCFALLTPAAAFQTLSPEGWRLTQHGHYLETGAQVLRSLPSLDGVTLAFRNRDVAVGMLSSLSPERRRRLAPVTVTNGQKLLNQLRQGSGAAYMDFYYGRPVPESIVLITDSQSSQLSSEYQVFAHSTGSQLISIANREGGPPISWLIARFNLGSLAVDPMNVDSEDLDSP